ncbi:unnamed protein product [Calypogeia fissa]
MAVAFSILPRLKDWNDPEMEKTQTEMGNQPPPSFSSLFERLQAEPTKLSEIAPRLKDWTDAEMEKAQTEMGNQPTPSFSSLLERLQAEPTLGEKGPTAATHKQAKRFQRR